jgi:hypothetical protein
MRIAAILMFVAIIIAGGCKNSPAKDDTGTIMSFTGNNLTSITVDDAPYERDFNVENIFDSVSFVRLSNEPEAIIGGIDQITLKDSLIFIRDCWSTKSVKMFSCDGKYIRHIGSHGRGPGEYLEPTYMEVTEYNIIIWDQFNMSLLFYDFNGKFQRSLEFPFMAMKFHYIDDDHIIFNTINSDNDKYSEIVNYSVFECNSNFEITSRGFYRKKDSYESILYNHNFFEQNETIFYHPSYCDTLYSINRNGIIEAEYAFDFGRKTVPEKLRKGNNKRLLRKEQAGSRYMFMKGDVHLTANHIHFGYIEAHREFDCIYSTTSQSVVSFHRRSGFFPLVFTNIIGSTEDAFIGYFFPAMIENQLNEWKKIPYDDLVSQFGKTRTELGFRIKPDDNPIITFFYP